MIIDQFADVRYIEERLAKEAERRDIEILQFPKPEAGLAVAAASILARESFLLWLQRETTESGFTLPKGANDLVIQAAREIVAARGEAARGGFVKLSFKTTEKVLGVAE